MRRPRRTHCGRGHEFTPESTYVRPNGDRQCRICWRVSDKNKKRSWRQTHKEEHREQQRRSYKKRQKAERARCSAYKKAHPDKARASDATRRTRKTKAGGSFTDIEWFALKKSHRFRCLRCGRKKKLTADHVIPVSKGGTSFISNIQPLCFSCNSSKGNRSSADYRV